MDFSKFGQKMTSQAAIVDLMEDLGHALNVNPDLLFLGGGNPAQVPEFESCIREHLKSIADDHDALHRLVGVYQSPRGSEQFIAALQEFLSERLGWQISEQNVAITNGSQSAFFMLINMLAGSRDDDVRVGQEGPGGNGEGRVAFPMMPEYLGYADQAGEQNAFRGVKPKIQLNGDERFKYQVDFDAFELADNDVAVCVSRPTNPTGNVLTVEELQRLSTMAERKGIPLIIDCAYGEPFPGILYDEKTLPYFKNTVYVFSCSKLGLPGARTGIVVGPQAIVDALVKMNTVMSLANGNLGPSLMTSLLEKKVLASLCDDVLLPFYHKKRDFAIACIEKYFHGIEYRLHEPEGAFFLWLWFPTLGMSSTELYERLKTRGVLVMDGAHFFFGLDQTWDHAKQCLRLTYCQDDTVIEKGISIIAEELKAV